MNIVNLRLLARVVLLAVVLGLAACSGGDVRPSDRTAELADEYDLILVAFTSGQFQVGDGAVLTAPDLASHFAYLESEQRMPTTVLLKNGDESEVRSSHLRAFTSLQAEYGFSAFVEYHDAIEPLHSPEDD